MEKEDSHAVENLYENYYFAPEIKTDEKNCLITNKLSGACSEFKNFIKSNKIPEYAKEYKREYQFIRGINKEFKNLKDRDYDEYGADKVRNLLKRFLREQEKGKLKEINELYFWKNDILDIIEFYYEVKPDFYFQQYNLDFEFILIFDKFYDKINFKYYDWDGNIKVKECVM